MHIICAGAVLVSFLLSASVHLLFLMLDSTSAYTRNMVAAIYIIPHYHYNYILFGYATDVTSFLPSTHSAVATK